MKFDSTGIRLLPCPFCGGSASMNETEHDGKFYYSVGCENLKCRGTHSPHSTLDGVGEVLKWNSRTQITEAG